MTAPDTPLAITPTDNGFAVVGEIDAHTAPEISAAVAQATTPTLEIDLSRVDFVDSSGLRALIEAHQRFEANGGSLTLVRPSAVVARLFDISGVGDYLNVTD
jgi:anti-sigma B factor antagonist